MLNATIQVTGLRKRFGPTVALDGMSFTVGPGQVTGFVGPNGAGKSTTMRVILGLDAADAGSALIGGQRYQSLRHPTVAIGPGGEAVTDDFYFVHQSLDGNGSITVRVTSLHTELPMTTSAPHIA